MFNYVGTPITLDIEVRDEFDVLTPAVEVQFWWRTGFGGLIHKDVIPTMPDFGVYRIIFTPDQGGTIFWRFVSTTPTVVSNGRLYVEKPEFDEVPQSSSNWV